jgi:hypothetical protein
MVLKSPKVKYDIVLAVRKLREGNFVGLWEAVELDEKGEVKRVITDANMKSMAADLVARAVKRCL